jgi:hypothetical protein
VNTPNAFSSDIWRSGIIPTIAALIVTSVQIIERAQVEWAAECGVPGTCATVQSGEFFGGMLGWLPAAFVFAVLHAALRSYPARIDASRADRLGRVVMFMALNVYPHMGWYLALAGIAAGFLAAVTVIGLIVSPVVGLIGATWFGGLVLGVVAGPSFTAGWPVWRSTLLRYGNASVLSGMVLAAGYGLFDPQFSLIAGAYPWLDALGLLIATAVACCIVWVRTLDAHEPVRAGLPWPALTRPGGVLAMAVAVVIVPTVLALNANMKPLAAFENTAPSAVAFMRGYKPPLTMRVQLAGLDFVGARSQITLRSRDRREHMPGGYAISWRMVPPLHGQDEIYIVADNGGADLELLCVVPSAGLRLCFRDAYVAHERSTEPIRRAMTFQSEDAFEDISDLPDAYFGINFDKALKKNGVALADGPRRYCRLGLVNVTAARLSVHQIVPCDQPWKEQAIRLRAHVESLFKSPARS